jgi:hypothetical protein
MMTLYEHMEPLFKKGLTNAQIKKELRWKLMTNIDTSAIIWYRRKYNATKGA